MANVPSINTRHIFHGEIRVHPNGTRRPVGFHHKGFSIGQQGRARVVTVIRGPNSLGVYEAEIEVYDATDNVWRGKFSTMFPDSWNRGQVVHAIREAYADAIKTGAIAPGADGVFEGIGDGIQIRGYVRGGVIDSAHPIYTP